MDDAMKMILDARKRKDYSKIPEIVRVMKKNRGNPDLLREAMQTFRIFARDDAKSRSEIAKVGGIEEIIDGMRSFMKSETLLVLGCGALWKLALDPQNDKRIGKKGIEVILRAMVSHKTSEAVNEHGCGALKNLALDPQNDKRIGKKGIEVILRAMVSHKTSEAVNEHGCGALKHLAVNPQNDKHIGKEGIEVILRAMVSHKTSEAVNEHGCGALLNLAVDPQNDKHIGKEGIEVILRAMVSHKTSEAVNENGWGALDNLAHNPQNRKHINDFGGIAACLRAVRAFPANSDLQKYGRQALAKLTDTAEGQLCSHFLKGPCPFGAKCWFVHPSGGPTTIGGSSAFAGTGNGFAASSTTAATSSGGGGVASSTFGASSGAASKSSKHDDDDDDDAAASSTAATKLPVASSGGATKSSEADDDDDAVTLSTRKYDIFISYRRSRVAEAQLLKKTLEELGSFRVFLDVDRRDGLGAGKFQAQLERVLRDTPVVIVMVTPAPSGPDETGKGGIDRSRLSSMAHIKEYSSKGWTDWCHKEMAIAVKLDKIIVPVYPGVEGGAFIGKELAHLKGLTDVEEVQKQNAFPWYSDMYEPSVKQIVNAIKLKLHAKRNSLRKESVPLDGHIVDAAQFAYDKYLCKKYPSPPANAKKAYFIDLDSKYGVERPNHALCHAVRKAILLPHVVAAYKSSKKMHDKYGSSFDFSADVVRSAQIAMIFSRCGRQSDIGFSDDKKVYLEYYETSCDAFERYAKSKSLEQKAVDALTHIASPPPALRPLARVLEVTHELDLFRCVKRDLMVKKMEEIAREIGRSNTDALARRSEAAILATGDRLMSSCFGPLSRDYVPQTFNECSTDVRHCLRVAALASSFRFPHPYVRGELMISRPPCASCGKGGSRKQEPLRLLTSNFRRVYSSTNARWRTTKYWAFSPATDRKTKENKVKRRMHRFLWFLISKFAESKSVDEDAADDFVQSLWHDAIDEKRPIPLGCSIAEVVAIRLWSSSKTMRVGNRDVELSQILNEIVRTDGGPAFEYGVQLVCAIQHYLTAGRRRDQKQFVRPLGPGAVDASGNKLRGWSTTKNVVYRGGGLPKKHLAFFQHLKGTGRFFRAPQLVATSFVKNTTEKFRKRVKSHPTVLWKIKIPEDGDVMHVNFIGEKMSKCRGEYEYLFSAYSAFKVIEVKESKNPFDWTKPHEITLEAVKDNALVSESVPTAPWC